MILANKILITLYFLVAIVYTYYRLFIDIQKLLIFKSALLILLILQYLFATKKTNYIFLFILILEFIGGLLFSFSSENFLVGVTFFFLINLLLTVIVTKDIESIKTKDISKALIFIILIIITTTYFTFKSTGYMRLLLIIFAAIFSLLISLSYINYKRISNDYTLYFFIGVVLFLFRYMIGGYVRLVESNKILILIESISYVLGLFLLCKAMIIDSKEIEK